MDGLPLPHPQRRNKRLLRNAHITILTHPCSRENSAPRCFLILLHCLFSAFPAAFSYG